MRKEVSWKTEYKVGGGRGGGGVGTAGNHRSKAGKVRQKDRSWARKKDGEETGVGVGWGAQKQESEAEIRLGWGSRVG